MAGGSRNESLDHGVGVGMRRRQAGALNGVAPAHSQKASPALTAEPAPELRPMRLTESQVSLSPMHLDS